MLRGKEPLEMRSVGFTLDPRATLPLPAGPILPPGNVFRVWPARATMGATTYRWEGSCRAILTPLHML